LPYLLHLLLFNLSPGKNSQNLTGHNKVLIFVALSCKQKKNSIFAAKQGTLYQV